VGFIIASVRADAYPKAAVEDSLGGDSWLIYLASAFRAQTQSLFDSAFAVRFAAYL